MIRVIEQISVEQETCTRCARLKRPAIIRVGEWHWALLDTDGDADAPPRAILCVPCRRFVKEAAAS